ncbi:MAG: hypothetical protein AAGD04_10100 [Pseudomonadota bacterium]
MTDMTDLNEVKARLAQALVRINAGVDALPSGTDANSGGGSDVGALENQVAELEAHVAELTHANAQLAEVNGQLVDAMGVSEGDFHLINSAMMAELGALRAEREGDRSQLRAILADLDAVLGAAQ